MEHIDDIRQKHICISCVGQELICERIGALNSFSTCSYCGEEDAPTITIEALSHDVETAFDSHFQLTSPDPDGFEYAMIKEGIHDWERHGDPVGVVIAEMLEIDEEPAEDIRRVLEDKHEDLERAQMGDEGPFDDTAHYEKADVDDGEFQAEWRRFEQSLTEQNRFFNKDAEAVLKMVFEDIAGAVTRSGEAIICVCGPGSPVSEIFRARVFQDDANLENAIKFPDREIGAPPTSAAAAGRMNARGISVFYGATDQNIAIAEVRPPVGSRVVVGRFEIIRQIRLLDVGALEALFVAGSVFDPSYKKRLERARFLQRLSARIMMPVMPNDEAVHHLVTQAMADYLVGRSDLNLDGILFRSVQSKVPGSNVVLFHRSCRCKPIKLPDGTRVKAYLNQATDAGFEDDYWVFEEVPARRPKTKSQPSWPENFSRFAEASSETDGRPITLRVDTSSLQVHRIKAVKFTTEAHRVYRHRAKKGSADIF